MNVTNQTSEIASSESCRRRIISAAICSLLSEAGYHSVETDVLGTLVEIFQSRKYRDRGRKLSLYILESW